MTDREDFTEPSLFTLNSYYIYCLFLFVVSLCYTQVLFIWCLCLCLAQDVQCLVTFISGVYVSIHTLALATTCLSSKQVLSNIPSSSTVGVFSGPRPADVVLRCPEMQKVGNTGCYLCNVFRLASRQYVLNLGRSYCGRWQVILATSGQIPRDIPNYGVQQNQRKGLKILLALTEYSLDNHPG